MAKLPDTRDPYALLGVSPDADARELKRAYVRLIKDYKPEQHPQEFQRIREAYEAVRDEARMQQPRRRPLSQAPEVHEGKSESEAEARGLVDAAPALPTEVVREAPPFSPDDAEAEPIPPVSLRMRRPAPGFMPDSAAHESMRDTAEALAVLLSEDEGRARPLLDALHAQGKLRWEVLRSRPDRSVAVLLFIEHLDRELLAGRAQAVIGQLASAEFEREVLRTPALEKAIWHVLAFTGFVDPQATLGLLREHPGTPSSQDEQLLLLEQTFPVAEAYQRLRSVVQLPPGLARLIELGRIERTPGPVAQRALSELLLEGPRVLAALDLLQEHSPHFISHILGTADQWMPPDDRLWQELSMPERSWVTAAMRDIERKAGKSIYSNMWLLFLVALCGVGCLAFSWLGLWLGGLATVVAFVAMAFGMIPVDHYIYRRDVRPLLLERIAVRGVSPDRVVELLYNERIDGSNLKHFRSEIEADQALYAVSALHRVRTELLALRRAAPAPSDAPSATLQQAFPPSPTSNQHAPAAPATPPRPGAKTQARPGAAVAPSPSTLHDAQELDKFVPGSAHARAQRCSVHADMPLLGLCTHCRRATCSKCSILDDTVGLFCSNCQKPRHEALRSALGATESKFRALGSLFALLAAFALLSAAALSKAASASPLQGIVIALLLALLSVPPRMLWRHARLVPAPLFVVALAAFPLGTVLGLRGLDFLTSGPTKRLFTDEYRATMAATPHVRISRTHVIADWLAGIVALLAVASFVSRLF